MKTTTLALQHSMNHAPCQLALLLIALALACFALSPQARAVCQDGCLTNSNTALGENALVNDVSGVSNTAVGGIALQFNTDGAYNTAVGFGALQFNTTGSENTAVGYGPLTSNTTGQQNVAAGRAALEVNTSGSKNTASGYLALGANTMGNFNTATGGYALAHNTIGSNNIAVGLKAGSNLTTGSNNIDIGNLGVTGESQTLRIGTTGTQTNAYVAGISGVTVAGGVGVVIDANGHLGTTVSSARFKEAVKPMDKASEAILALKPVTFRYKHDLDPEGIPQFGLVAEEVEKVNPDLVARDKQGKPYTVRYETVNAMLLNEFLKEHKKVEMLEAKVAKLEATLEKVSARLETEQAVPRLVESR